MKRNYVKTFSSLALLAAFTVALAIGLTRPPSPQIRLGTELQQFASYEDFADFVNNGTPYPYYYTNDWRGDLTLGAAEDGKACASMAPEYSTTNIQVEGVDEADIVKTDGEYLYIVIDSRLVIVRAYPPEEAMVLSEIEADGAIAGIFVNEDRLTLFENTAPVYATEPYETDLRFITPQQQRVTIKVYDISNRDKPVLKRDLGVDGYYVSSRMIGGFVYVIVNGSAYGDDNQPVTPGIYSDGSVTDISASDIWHSEVPDYSYMLTTIMAISLDDDELEPFHQTLLMGAASGLYVSMTNIYVTFPGQAVEATTTGIMPENSYYTPKTAIHRIRIDDGVIELDGSGEVPGRLLNQFSMDEHQGYFRVATTTDDYSREGGMTLTNQVYILDDTLNIVGRLENLAPGEQIHSARFMGNRCYLVTFRNIDPLFVVDLKDPYNPRVLGELKVTGYSDYLHPYDETHIIGIGKEAIAENEDFAWYQGVKISLFDVSDVSEPKEIAKYEIGDRGTDSPVLSDHKALLFDRSRNLLVIPVLVAEVDAADYPYGILPHAYGEPVWQGAYVFNISLEKGLELRGGITHCAGAEFSQYGYRYSADCFVERSLFIEDVLYTISDAKVKMNDLDDLNEIGEVILQ